MKKIFALCVLAALILSIGGCGGGSGSSQTLIGNKTTVSINLGETRAAVGSQLETAAIPTPVTSITIMITAADMATIERVVSVAGKTGIVESFEVPNGANRHFLIGAVDVAGNVLYRGETFANLDGTATTLSIVMVSTDPIPPTFAGLADITLITTTSMRLSWQAATDDVTPQSKIQYLIYVSTVSGGQNFASPNFTTATGATSFDVTGLNPDTTYFFVVRAMDERGNLDTNTAEKSAKTLALPDTQPPAFEGILSASPLSPQSIDLSWNPASDNVTPQSRIVYLIYRSITSGGENFAIPSFVTSPGATRFTVTGLTPATTYFFVVRARDEFGNTDGNSVEKSATTPSDEGTSPPDRDTSPPTVLTTNPSSGASGVAVNSPISATFSEPMNASTINTATFLLVETFCSECVNIPGVIAFSGATVTFTPSGNLLFNTTYTATIASGVTDLAGNPLASDFTWSFTTAPASLDLSIPSVGDNTTFISFDVHNSGSVDATDVFVVVLFSSVAGVGCDTFTIPSIPPGGFPNHVTFTPVPNNWRIIVDPFNSIAETNESNNESCGGIFCTSPPDPGLCF